MEVLKPADGAARLAIASPLPVACAVIGALVVLRSPQLPGWQQIVAMSVLGLLLCAARDVVRCAGMLLLGAAWLAIRGTLALEARLPESRSGMDHGIGGQVIGLPRFEPERTVFDFRADSGPVRGLVRLAWYRPASRIEAGARLDLEVRLRTPRGTRNAGGFDYEAYALQRGIRAQGYLLAPPQVRDAGIDWRGRLDRARSDFSRRIAREVADRRAANLLRTLIVGDQGALSSRDWETLRRTGTTHLVAISGFHIGIVGGFAALLAGGFWRLWPGLALRVPRRIAQAFVAILAATVYGLLAGISLPVLRTLLMIATVALAAMSRRHVSVAHSLGLAAGIVLLVDPLGLLAAGFWLSFAGVAWLIFCLQGRSRKRSLWVDFTRAQGVMAIALLPLSIWFFQQASLIGAWMNLIAVPWISLVTVPLGLLALALHAFGVSGTPWSSVLQGAVASAHLFWQLLDATASWPGGQWFLPRPSLPVLLLAVAGTVLLLLPRGTGGRIAGVLLLLPLVAPRDASPAIGSVRMTLIDVGQGQSTLLRTHSHSLLIDTGPSFASGLDMGEAAVVPTLRAVGVKALDGLIISHGDNDHDGGTPSVRSAHAPPRLLHSEPPAGWTRCRSGQRWRWDGVDFEVLHPPRWFPGMGNESSCVVLVRTARGSLLVPGDIGAVIEERLLREHPGLQGINVVVAAHHGSRGSSAPAWVDRLSPDFALFSAGAGNRFGHPDPDVLARWRDAGAATLTTIDCGAIEMTLGPDGIAKPPFCTRRDDPRWWGQP